MRILTELSCRVPLGPCPQKYLALFTVAYRVHIQMFLHDPQASLRTLKHLFSFYDQTYRSVNRKRVKYVIESRPCHRCHCSSMDHFRENAALGSRTYIVEDGPYLPTESGPHAKEGGEILSGMYAQVCTRVEDSRLRGGSGRTGGLDTVSGAGSKASALAISTRSQYLPTRLFIARPRGAVSAGS
jgi:hypothetical protein